MIVMGSLRRTYFKKSAVFGGLQHSPIIDLIWSITSIIQGSPG